MTGPTVFRVAKRGSAGLAIKFDRLLQIGRRVHNPFRRKPYSDRGADVDLTLQIEGTAVHLDQGLGQRQAETGAVVATVELAVDLAELN